MRIDCYRWQLHCKHCGVSLYYSLNDRVSNKNPFFLVFEIIYFQVQGSIWSIDYKSTYTLDDCPGSQYSDLPTEIQITPSTNTLPPTESDDENNSLSNIKSSSHAIFISRIPWSLFSLLLPVIAM
jgi:hypothetical protein